MKEQDGLTQRWKVKSYKETGELGSAKRHRRYHRAVGVGKKKGFCRRTSPFPVKKEAKSSTTSGAGKLENESRVCYR